MDEMGVGESLLKVPFRYALLSINLMATNYVGLMRELTRWCFSVTF